MVEDEAGVRERIAKTIAWQEHGFVLEGCGENGEQALELQQKQPVDLIITDINMPVMNGLALSKEIYENWPDTQIVIISGFDDFSYAQQAIKYRVYDYLLKPVTAKQLRGLLDKLKLELDSKKIEQGKPTEFFEEILLGRLSREETKQKKAEYESLIGKAPYCIAVLEIFSEETSSISHHLDFRQILEKQTQSSGNIIRDDSGKFIVFYSGEYAKENLQKMILRITQEEGTQISSVIGEEVGNLAEINSMYTGILGNWGQLYRMSVDDIVCLQDIMEIEEHKPQMGNLRRQVTQAIKLIDEERATKALNKFVKELKHSSYEKSEIVNQLRKLLLLINEYSDEQELRFPLRVFEQLDIQPNLARAHLLLRQTVENILSQSKNQGDSSSRQVLLAIEYIKANYNRAELAIKHVTDYLSVSTSHFCIIFKNHTGTTFLEFLTRIRMNKAQELIITTDMKSYETAERVGYDDPGYFRSVFKKFTGMSPSQYRKKNGR